MSEPSVATPIRCRFEHCALETVRQVTLAVVDQVAAALDADIALLDALDYPLSDGLDALHRLDIELIDVSEVDGDLVVEVHVGSSTPDVAQALGSSLDAVQIFFDVSIPLPGVVRLHGALR